MSHSSRAPGERATLNATLVLAAWLLAVEETRGDSSTSWHFTPGGLVRTRTHFRSPLASGSYYDLLAVFCFFFMCVCASVVDRFETRDVSNRAVTLRRREPRAGVAV